MLLAASSRRTLNFAKDISDYTTDAFELSVPTRWEAHFGSARSSGTLDGQFSIFITLFQVEHLQANKMKITIISFISFPVTVSSKLTSTGSIDKLKMSMPQRAYSCEATGFTWCPFAPLALRIF
jgi:hypothetical protein